jgi:hypothetical protein
MNDAGRARLEQMEADISSVATALESVDRVVAETADGESAAAEIRALVSPERFPLGTDSPTGPGSSSAQPQPPAAEPQVG